MSDRSNDTAAQFGDALLDTLGQLLAIATPELRPTLDEASTLVAQTLGADKVDVFLYEADKDSLVALGTSHTAMGRKQHALGLDRFPRANAGPITAVYETGVPYITGHADQDPSQPRGVTEALGVRSQVDVPLEVQGERRGVLAAVSAQTDAFTEREVRFLQAVAGWIGLLIQRAEMTKALEQAARRQGRQDAADELARLTRRQREVAALVAEGLTNEELAQRLMTTPGTMANHLDQILTRLGLRNRTQLAVWAVTHGLFRPGAEETDEL